MSTAVPPAPSALPAPLTAFADALLQATLDRRSIALPEGFAQRCSEEQGNVIAALNSARLAARLGGGVSGTKLGATNPAALAKLGLERPFHGPILSARSFASPASLPRDEFILCIIEAELGVRFGADIGGAAEPPSRAALAAAVDAVFPVIEIADSRLADWQSAPPAAIFADLGYAGALVTGAAVTDWRGLDLAGMTVRLSANGAEVRQGNGAAVMGHPLEALAGFVAERGRRGQTVRAGEIVSTGTWTAPYLGQRGELLVADFGALGQVSVRLT